MVPSSVTIVLLIISFTAGVMSAFAYAMNRAHRFVVHWQERAGRRLLIESAKRDEETLDWALWDGEIDEAPEESW